MSVRPARVDCAADESVALTNRCEPPLVEMLPREFEELGFVRSLHLMDHPIETSMRLVGFQQSASLASASGDSIIQMTRRTPFSELQDFTAV
jgi:hypothetical protein